jgi:hypothetical protein
MKGPPDIKSELRCIIPKLLFMHLSAVIWLREKQEENTGFEIHLRQSDGWTCIKL